MLQEQRISVIVPIYKVEAYLERCVESIVNQTYRNMEIILVDDGSPDNCPAMCDAWAKKDSRIKVIHKPNGGLSDARNAGMAIASGEYIGFVDSDDWIAPEMYERLANALEQDGSDIAACGVEMVWEDESPSCSLITAKREVLDHQQAQKGLLLENKMKQPVWYKLYRAETIQDILFPMGKYHEDVFWSYQAVGNARTVSLVDYVGYFYWQRSGSIMGERYSLRRLDAIEAICERHHYLQDNFPNLVSTSTRKIWEACLYHGQMCLRDLTGEDYCFAMELLKKTLSLYTLSKEDRALLHGKKKLWILLEGVSLPMTCRVRNWLKIGL